MPPARDERCTQVNGTYPVLADPKEKHRSSVHALAILTKFPNSVDIENLRGLKRGLTDGLRTRGIMVSYAVTANSACTEPTLAECRSKFEEALTLPQGRTAMLDTVHLSVPSRQALPQEYDEVIHMTHPAFLEPDRILKVLEQLHAHARIFYKSEAARRFKTDG